VNSYNHAMPVAAPRRVGVAGLLGLLAGALVLMLAPGNPGALRLAGIGLLWWYATVVAPLAALLLVIVVQRLSPGPASRQPRVLAVAAWTSPVLLALVASRAFSGMPDAPSLAPSALVAPLIALLAPASSAERRPNLVALMAAGVGAGLVIWANLLLFGDVAGLIGFPRWAATLLATIIALLAIELAHTADAPEKGASSREGAERRTGRRVYRMALRGGGLTLLYTSALGFVALVGLIAVALAISPWGAWRAVASRPALTFSEASAWVTDGRTLARWTALDFTEAQRVTALSPATYRVLEPGRFREGQLHSGESLALRAGDRLVLAAGARLRFEAGKRIPGSPASGIAWADPPERSSLPSVLGALGATVTLVGGALAFVGSRRALAAPTVYTGSGLLLVLVLASLSLGVFGAYAAPGLSIGVPTLAAVFDLPAAIVPGPPGRVLGVLGAAVLLILFAATALALRDVINRALRTPDGKGSDAAGGRAKLVRPIMRTFLVVACAASFWSGDASRALLTGLGLAASAMLATLLADDEPGARLVGSLSGVIVFAGVSLLGARLPAWAAAAGAYPVLAAIPLAWAAVSLWSFVAGSRR
jgi:hypothetical protein